MDNTTFLFVAALVIGLWWWGMRMRAQRNFATAVALAAEARAGELEKLLEQSMGHTFDLLVRNIAKGGDN